MGTVGFSLSHQSRYALHLLNGILGEGMSSRLYQSVREKHGLAYSVYSFASMLTDTGTVGVYAGTDDANVDHAIGLIQKEINLLVKTRVRPDELHRTKSQLKGSLMLGLESMSNRMMRLGGGELHHEPYRTIDQILEKIDGVTARNVQEVAEQLFDRSGFSTVIIRPEEQQRA